MYVPFRDALFMPPEQRTMVRVPLDGLLPADSPGGVLHIPQGEPSYPNARRRVPRQIHVRAHPQPCRAPTILGSGWRMRNSSRPCWRYRRSCRGHREDGGLNETPCWNVRMCLISPTWAASYTESVQTFRGTLCCTWPACTVYNSYIFNVKFIHFKLYIHDSW